MGIANKSKKDQADKAAEKEKEMANITVYSMNREFEIQRQFFDEVSDLRDKAIEEQVPGFGEEGSARLRNIRAKIDGNSRLALEAAMFQTWCETQYQDDLTNFANLRSTIASTYMVFLRDQKLDLQKAAVEQKRADIAKSLADYSLLATKYKEYELNWAQVQNQMYQFTQDAMKGLVAAVTTNPGVLIFPTGSTCNTSDSWLYSSIVNASTAGIDSLLDGNVVGVPTTPTITTPAGKLVPYTGEIGLNTKGWEDPGTADEPGLSYAQRFKRGHDLARSLGNPTWMILNGSDIVGYTGGTEYLGLHMDCGTGWSAGGDWYIKEAKLYNANVAGLGVTNPCLSARFAIANRSAKVHNMRWQNKMDDGWEWTSPYTNSGFCQCTHCNYVGKQGSSAGYDEDQNWRGGGVINFADVAPGACLNVDRITPVPKDGLNRRLSGLAVGWSTQTKFDWLSEDGKSMVQPAAQPYEVNGWGHFFDKKWDADSNVCLAETWVKGLGVALRTNFKTIVDRAIEDGLLKNQGVGATTTQNLEDVYGDLAKENITAENAILWLYAAAGLLMLLSKRLEVLSSALSAAVLACDDLNPVPATALTEANDMMSTDLWDTTMSATKCSCGVGYIAAKLLGVSNRLPSVITELKGDAGSDSLPSTDAAIDAALAVIDQDGTTYITGWAADGIVRGSLNMDVAAESRAHQTTILGQTVEGTES